MVSISKLKRLEWSVLTSFLSVCHTGSLSNSAKLLKVSRSTMSERLSKLEALLGIEVLTREHKKIHVNEQGMYLAKYVLPLVILENFAFEHKDSDESFQWVSLDFPLRNYGNRMCTALEKLIQTYQVKYPNTLVLPQSFDSYDVRPTQEMQWQPSWVKVGSIRLRWETQLDPVCPNTNHVVGNWCVVSHISNGLSASISLAQLATLKVLLPRMPWVLLQQIATLSQSIQLTFEQISQDYCQFFYATDANSSFFIINSLLIDENKLPEDWQISTIDYFACAYLCLEGEGSHPIVTEMIEAFPEVLFQNKETVTWQTQSQLKHWHYMHQAMQAGSITTAAQQLYMSQSALSTQLKHFEAMFGHTLLQRSMGVRRVMPTDYGRLFSELFDGLDSIFSYLLDQSDRQRQDQKKHLILGILPSIDTKSTFVRMMVNQVNAWQKEYPDIKLEIVEERHRYLIDALRSNEIHLAVVEADSPWVTHIPIQQPEEMGLVISPKLVNSGVDVMDWNELEAFQLVLPRQGTGMRQIIDKHCLNLGVKLKPAIESDSLNINQYWIQEGKYAAILPKSAVAQMVENQTMKFISLKPTLNRVLRLAYLNNRVLSRIENSLLQFLLK